MSSLLPARSRGGVSSLLPAACLLAVSLIVVGSLRLHPPADATQVAVLFPFGTGLGEAIDRLERVDARVVRTGWRDLLVVAELADGTPPGRLRAVGAWLVADPVVLGGCFVSVPATAGTLAPVRGY